MPKKTPHQRHAFRDKLLLNLWIIRLFGISPYGERRNSENRRPFEVLTEGLKDEKHEGLDADNRHRFFRELVTSEFFRRPECRLTEAGLQRYEDNIVFHTQQINRSRTAQPITWKYFQWLTLLFTEIYLDRYFSDRELLLAELNAFVTEFNAHWREFEAMPVFTADQLNKICLQSATGSGKTLLMHINFLQFRHYAGQTTDGRELSRSFLLTPNERLSTQHLGNFAKSGIDAGSYLRSRGGMFEGLGGADCIDILEITKLAEKDGPGTVATRSLGDRNLLLVDEGHRGISGKDKKKDEQVWFSRRAALCEKGFSFEYSATFEQAVGGTAHESDYAKTILFDYSYRWFYGDGFGKDYRIFNIPKSYAEMEATYLTACLLKFYQQLRVYEENRGVITPFRIEKPLWVFVGSTVSQVGTKGETNDEKLVVSDVGRIIHFLARFLAEPGTAARRIEAILRQSGEETGLLDREGNDIFLNEFGFLIERFAAGEQADSLYRDILQRVFQNAAGGQLEICRIKGSVGEIALKAGAAERPFGLINVGDAKGLADHLASTARDHATPLTVSESEFAEGLFKTAHESFSPVNILIGSKKFVEGWDCYRVSTMGLMHVGKGEGAQIIQLFGRGVRLKGYEHSLKRSSFTPAAATRPAQIELLETLNIFGIEADFMASFRDFLDREGLPRNDRQHTEKIPLTVTYDFGKGLKILRPKRKAGDGKEYDFREDGAAPVFGNVPEALTRNRISVDWFPRIQTLIAGQVSETGLKRQAVSFPAEYLLLLDEDSLYFQVERYKRQRGWHNFLIPRDSIRQLLERSDWYELYAPESLLRPADYGGIGLLQQLAAELLKRFAERYYNFCRRAYLEPRLELRELTPSDENFPLETEYSLTFDASETRLIADIEQLKQDLAANGGAFSLSKQVSGLKWPNHLYEPLLRLRKGSKVSVVPVALNESEAQFVKDLKEWCEKEADGIEVYLLRNLSKGKGVGFFEANGFHPDFILWAVTGGKQHIIFIEPHGLMHEDPKSQKVMFHRRIKDIERRLGDSSITLHSFIVTPTRSADLGESWGMAINEPAKRNVLFMYDPPSTYIGTIFARMCV